MKLSFFGNKIHLALSACLPLSYNHLQFQISEINTARPRIRSSLEMAGRVMIMDWDLRNAPFHAWTLSSWTKLT